MQILSRQGICSLTSCHSHNNKTFSRCERVSDLEIVLISDLEGGLLGQRLKPLISDLLLEDLLLGQRLIIFFDQYRSLIVGAKLFARCERAKGQPDRAGTTYGG